MTSFLQAKNRASTILSANIDADDLSLTVENGAVFPSAFPFHITINSELLNCTNRAANVLTVTRGAESTTPAAHSAGQPVSLNITAEVISEIQGAINAAEATILGGEFHFTPKAASTGAEGTMFYNSGDDAVYVGTEA